MSTTMKVKDALKITDSIYTYRKDAWFKLQPARMGVSNRVEAQEG